MRVPLIWISVLLTCVLLIRSHHLGMRVSQTPDIEYQIRELTRHSEEQYAETKLFVLQRLHTQDPQSQSYSFTIKILHELDSLYRRYRYGPNGLIQVVEHLNALTQASSWFDEVDLQLPPDVYTSPNKHLWCEYYKAKFLSAFMEALLTTTQRSDCMCLDQFSFIQEFDPVSKDYLVHFGSFGRCADTYYHIRVNDQLARHGEFTYTPMKVGIDSLLIEIERFDAKANMVLQDTFYYPIEVVASLVDSRS